MFRSTTHLVVVVIESFVVDVARTPRRRDETVRSFSSFVRACVRVRSFELRVRGVCVCVCVRLVCFSFDKMVQTLMNQVAPVPTRLTAAKRCERNEEGRVWCEERRKGRRKGEKGFWMDRSRRSSWT